MTNILQCYEYLLLKRLEEDEELWEELQKKYLKCREKPILFHNTPQDLWFLAITLEKATERFAKFIQNINEKGIVPRVDESFFSLYVNSHDFVELHLDNIFKYGESGSLPRELFRCPNVQALSLRHNFLESLPPDIAELKKLQYLALTNNRLQNWSIPYTLTFCKKLSVLLLDNNLLDALPGFLLMIQSLQTVHRHGNHNYFKATFMWYHTDVNDRILYVSNLCKSDGLYHPKSLQYLSARAVVASKLNFYECQNIPQILKDYISSMYFDFLICGNCPKAKLHSESGYKVFTFKNPYLGNTCVPFQHWACCLECAEAIEIPARIEQILASMEQDRQYNTTVQEAQDKSEYRPRNGFTFSCCIL